MSNNQKFTCDTDKIRLDKFLVEKMPDTTRSQLQNLIKQGSVLVNEKQSKKSDVLKDGDEILISNSQSPIPNKGNLKLGIRNLDIQLNIIHEDDNIIVVNKPSGVIVHQFEAQEEYSLADELIKHCPELKEVGEDPMRPGIVHRLDKNVSGLMVVAKNNKSFKYLKNQFQKRKVYKEYYALVHGKIENKTGTIDFPIARSTTKKHKMAAFPKNHEDAREAISHYDLINYYKKYSLLKVRIETGRTHQIRVHLNALDYPVVGDPVYTNRNVKPTFPIDRVFLHAVTLSFDGLDGERLEFKSQLPVELKNYLDKINNRHKFIIVSGPSGVGKTTIIKEFLKDNNEFTPNVTYTTRENRKGEVEDKIMHNVSDDEFKKLMKKNEFLETAEVHGKLYGTHIKTIDFLKTKHVIENIDVQGAMKILDKIPEAHTIFIDVKDIEDLKKRLIKRGEKDPEEIKRRMDDVLKEREYINRYDNLMYNEDGELEQAVKEFERIVGRIVRNGK